MTIFAKKIGYMHKWVQSKNINFRLGSVDWLTGVRRSVDVESEDWLTGVGKYFVFVTKTFCVNCKVVRCSLPYNFLLRVSSGRSRSEFVFSACNTQK